jgi:[acyl-carrier-protein] S-malonyltransferase
MPFSSAVKAVRIRGQAMQSAVPVGQGGMVAVMGLDPAQIETLCKWAMEKSKTSPLNPANFNCPGQIVVSGSAKTIAWLKENFKAEEVFPDAKRVKMIPLQVSAPFHCDMMKPAEDRMRDVLTEIPFKDAQFPIIQNFTAQIHQKASDLRENLIRQVSGSVRWMQSMDISREKGWTTCIEAGAGRVLQGLLKKIDSEAFQVFNTTSLEDIENIEKFVKSRA